MEWRTNLHPDGHIYLHGVPYNSAHPLTIFNRIEIENTGTQALHIGEIRFFPMEKSKAGFYGQLVFGLTDEGLLEPDTTLMVYFFQGSGAGYGYQGKLEIPVLNWRTGIHAHIFTAHVENLNQRVEPIGVHSGVFPVFIFEGLRLAIGPPDGKRDKVEPKESKRGEHLLLAFNEVSGTFHGGPDDPPKPPRYTVFFSYDPVAYVLEELGIGLPQIQQGNMLPVVEGKEELKINLPSMKNGILEQKLYTTWPDQTEEDALKINLPTMKDGLLEEKKYTTLPSQTDDGALSIHLPAMKDGVLEEQSYTSHAVTTARQLEIHLPAMRDGILEEI